MPGDGSSIQAAFAMQNRNSESPLKGTPGALMVGVTLLQASPSTGGEESGLVNVHSVLRLRLHGGSWKPGGF